MTKKLIKHILSIDVIYTYHFFSNILIIITTVFSSKKRNLIESLENVLVSTAGTRRQSSETISAISNFRIVGVILFPFFFVYVRFYKCISEICLTEIRQKAHRLCFVVTVLMQTPLLLTALENPNQIVEPTTDREQYSIDFETEDIQYQSYIVFLFFFFLFLVERIFSNTDNKVVCHQQTPYLYTQENLICFYVCATNRDNMNDKQAINIIKTSIYSCRKTIFNFASFHLHHHRLFDQ